MGGVCQYMFQRKLPRKIKHKPRLLCYNKSMISIEVLRQYCKNDSIFISNHAMERCRERGISVKDILNAIETGEIIEDYPED